MLAGRENPTAGTLCNTHNKSIGTAVNVPETYNHFRKFSVSALETELDKRNFLLTL